MFEAMLDNFGVILDPEAGWTDILAGWVDAGRSDLSLQEYVTM